LNGANTATEPHPGGNQDLVARYEEMRSQVLEGRGRDLGLALFLRHGMKAWVRASSECHLPPVTKSGELFRRNELVPAELRGQAASILAGIALSAWQKEGDDDRRQPEGEHRTS